MPTFFLAVSGCEGARPQPAGGSKQAAADTSLGTPPVALVPYDVVREEPYDVPLKTQLLEHIRVMKVPSEPELRHLLVSRAEAISKRTGFVHHPSPTNIGVYVYETAEQAQAGQALWLGMLFWRPVDGPPQITIDWMRLANAGKPSTERWGLSEFKRREIFTELVRTEDRSQAEAERKRPVLEVGGTLEQFTAQFELAKELQEQYERQLRRRYQITEDIADSITVEAMQRGWPQPEVGQ